MNRITGACALALALAACNAAESNSQQLPAAPAAPAPPAASPRRTADLLGAMASLVGFAPEPGYVADWAAKIDGGTATLDSYIDEILGTERFADEIMPTLLFGSFVNVRNYYAVPSGYVLKRADGDGPFYLRAPCTAAEAVSVKPWWDLTTPVAVCPDAYRPDKWTLTRDEQSYRTTMVLTCDSQVGSPELETKSLCGCGPNLIRCLRDQDQYDALNHSLMDEVKRTTAYVVEHDLPMASLFTGNPTFRDRNAELYYRRQKIGALQIEDPEPLLADLDRWPEDGKWAPREELRPGQHAGLLTAPQILHWLPDRRQRQRGYYEVLWCNLRNSFGATTHKVLELNQTGNIAFVHDSWKRMAHTELCMNCHARLDYGFQFFMAYPDSRASTHYVPALQSTATGPLYGRDIRDLRGEAPLTPLGFAELATAQPDFASCMTSHFVNYVLGDRATSDDQRAIEAAVEKSGTFKPPMKVALQRYAAKWLAGPAAAPAAPATPTTPAATAANGNVIVGAALHATVERFCVECHADAKYTDDPDGNTVPFDFTGDQLPRPLVVAMVDRVAFGMMPKDEPLDPEPRRDVVRQLIDALWTDPAARDEAEAYYLGRDQGLPAQQLDNALYIVDRIANAHPDTSWGALERGIWSDQATITPGFLATTSLEALRACERAHTDLDACLRRATSISALSRWPVSPAPQR